MKKQKTPPPPIVPPFLTAIDPQHDTLEQVDILTDRTLIALYRRRLDDIQAYAHYSQVQLPGWTLNLQDWRDLKTGVLRIHHPAGLIAMLIAGRTLGRTVNLWIRPDPTQPESENPTDAEEPCLTLEVTPIGSLNLYARRRHAWPEWSFRRDQTTAALDAINYDPAHPIARIYDENETLIELTDARAKLRAQAKATAGQTETV